MLTLLVIRFIIRLMQGGSFFIVPDISKPAAAMHSHNASVRV